MSQPFTSTHIIKRLQSNAQTKACQRVYFAWKEFIQNATFPTEREKENRKNEKYKPGLSHKVCK